ncbi:TPA: hypothetical protein DEW47_01970 [Patescibacteria group bacterium]|nr:hypothetical protein [Patescibacteria group bacterium]HCI04733.1 hypothetical protein [Patescibacteria group bacterium]
MGRKDDQLFVLIKNDIIKAMKFFRFDFLNFIFSRKANGFSLIELMVSVSILTVINMMVFASYPEFNQRMAIRRTSNDIALAVREAQVNALSIKELDGKFPAYGINFKTGNTFTLFADKGEEGVRNNLYDEGEEINTFMITTGDTISRLQLCSSGCNDTGEINIVYPRSNPMASITDSSGSGSNDYAIVTIAAPNDKISKDIKIYLNGQISIE